MEDIFSFKGEWEGDGEKLRNLLERLYGRCKERRIIVVVKDDDYRENGRKIL